MSLEDRVIYGAAAIALACFFGALAAMALLR